MLFVLFPEQQPNQGAHWLQKPNESCTAHELLFSIMVRSFCFCYVCIHCNIYYAMFILSAMRIQIAAIENMLIWLGAGWMCAARKTLILPIVCRHHYHRQVYRRQYHQLPPLHDSPPLWVRALHLCCSLRVCATAIKAIAFATQQFHYIFRRFLLPPHQHHFHSLIIRGWHKNRFCISNVSIAEMK